MKVLKYIILSLLVLLYGSQLYLGVMSTQVENLPKLFGVGEVVFLSGSMQPTIEVGSLGNVPIEDYRGFILPVCRDCYSRS